MARRRRRRREGERERELRPFPTLFFSPSIRSPFSPLFAQSLPPPPDTVPTIRIFFSRHQTRSTIVFHKFQPDHDPTNTLSHLFRGYVFSGKRKARHRCWWFPPTRPRVSRSIVSTYSRQRTNRLTTSFSHPTASFVPIPPSAIRFFPSSSSSSSSLIYSTVK